MPMTRRQTLKIGCAVLGFGLAGPAFARTEAASAIEAFTGGATPESGGIELDIPSVADNANAVPIRIRLTEPMTAEAFCEELIVIAERNPRPLACRFRFTPEIGVADIATRLRMAETQNVTVLARMSDGRLLGERRELTVTAGGCGF